MIVMIGPQWSPQRLRDPDDAVRAELQEARRSKKRIVPVLFGGASMPSEAELPPDLAWLPSCNGERVAPGLEWEDDARALAAKLCFLGRIQPYRSRVFLAGSDTRGSLTLAADLGVGLANTPISVVSAGGEAARILCMAMCETLNSRGLYRPERALFVYRRLPKRDAEPPRALPQRYGMIQYSELTDKDSLRRELIAQSVAALIVAGGDNSYREARMALDAGIPVISVAASGGAAAEIWREQRRNSHPLPSLGGDDARSRFEDLASSDSRSVVRATVALLELAVR